jgi:hypothetical protein
MAVHSAISIAERLALLPAKIRERGFGWLVERIYRSVRRALIWSVLVSIRGVVRATPFAKGWDSAVLVVQYDLEVYPISYDICWFLVWADLECKQRGLDGLHAIFVPIEDHKNRKFPPGYDEVVDKDSRQWRLHNICESMTQLVPSCRGVTVCSARSQVPSLELLTHNRWPESAPPPLSFIYRDIARRLRGGRLDWGFEASAQGLRYIERWLGPRAAGRKPIVVTLRHYGVDVERNSRLRDWIAFLKGLDQSRFFPVLVPDTDTAFDASPEFEGLTLCNEVAWNLGLRMALYQSAYLNLFVNSGPASLCILSPRCRYLLFKITVSGIHLASERTLRELGFEPGSTPAFATPYQRWVWDDDRLDVVAREFEAMVGRIEGSSSAEITHLAN